MGVRTDGLYGCFGRDEDWFVRFTADGNALFVTMQPERSPLSASGKAKRLYTYINELPATSRGRYTINADILSFSTTKSEGGVLDFSGRLLPDGDLVLDAYSHVNGQRRTGKRLTFFPVGRFYRWMETHS
jgi:hypothetical protein